MLHNGVAILIRASPNLVHGCARIPVGEEAGKSRFKFQKSSFMCFRAIRAIRKLKVNAGRSDVAQWCCHIS